MNKPNMTEWPPPSQTQRWLTLQNAELFCREKEWEKRQRLLSIMQSSVQPMWETLSAVFLKKRKVQKKKNNNRCNTAKRWYPQEITQPVIIIALQKLKNPKTLNITAYMWNIYKPHFLRFCPPCERCGCHWKPGVNPLLTQPKHSTARFSPSTRGSSPPANVSPCF